jgi:hypothetical protein
MMALVRTLVLSGIIDGKITVDAYNSILKSIMKLTLFLIRAIIIKDSIPLNPYNLTEIKTKRKLYEIKNAAMLDDLLDSYNDIRLCNSKEGCSMAEIERCLVRVIKHFNTTVAILTDTKYPSDCLPKKLVFGQYPFIQRLEHSMYILLTNVRTGWSIGLFKFIIFTILHPEDIYLKFYDLFLSSSSLIKSLGDEGSTNNQQRQSWLRLYNKSVQQWKYGVVEQA